MTGLRLHVFASANGSRVPWEQPALLPELRKRLAAISDPSPEPTGVGEPPSVSVFDNAGAGPQ